VGEGDHGLTLHRVHAVHWAAQFQAAAADGPCVAAGESCARGIAPARAHHQSYAVVTGDLHSPGVQHRGAQAGQFQHLVAADGRHQLGVGHFAGIGAQHTGHIGVDLTGVGTKGSRQGHGGGVGSAAPQGGDLVDAVTAGGGALEPRHNHDLSLLQPAADAIGADAEDAGSAVGGFGGDSHLGAGHRDGSHALGLQCHRQEGDRNLFSARQQHVHLPLGRTGVQASGEAGQFIGGVAHGGDHHHHVIAVLPAAADAISNGLDAFHAADGGAAELLHQEGHGPGFSNAGFSHPMGGDQPSSPSRKASPGRAPRFSRASTSSRRPSSDRKRLAGRPCSCLRIT